MDTVSTRIACFLGNMSRFDKIIILVFVLMLITVGVGFLGVVPGFILTNTRYAPSYSESRFDSIRTGDSEERVIERLGKPVQRHLSGYTFLEYSGRGWALWYNRRTVVLSNSVVIRTIKDFHFFE